MRTRTTIRSVLFAAVFFGVMSVSFLVVARDVPEGAVTVPTEPNEVAGPFVPQAVPASLDEIPDGLASWYGGYFHGRRTASGRRYNMNELTAAHKDLPFGTLVRAENTITGKAIVVEITDRGPYIKPRVIDLSRAAAKRIGVGVTSVQLSGILPVSLHQFYLDNDSTVVAITSDMDIVEMPFIALKNIKQQRSYSKAAKGMRDGDVVIVVLNRKGKPTYARARPRVDAVLAMTN